MIQGGSAGGLLMGAVVNMRPDLFKAVVAQVPFVDVHQHDARRQSLPLTTSEYIEWGNPNEQDGVRLHEDVLALRQRRREGAIRRCWSRSRSTTARCRTGKATKFVAKLRELKTDTNPLLLKVNMGAGHGGSSGRYDALRETAFDYAFMLTQMGISE